MTKMLGDTILKIIESKEDGKILVYVDSND